MTIAGENPVGARDISLEGARTLKGIGGLWGGFAALASWGATGSDLSSFPIVGAGISDLVVWGTFVAAIAGLYVSKRSCREAGGSGRCRRGVLVSFLMADWVILVWGGGVLMTRGVGVPSLGELVVGMAAVSAAAVGGAWVISRGGFSSARRRWTAGFLVGLSPALIQGIWVVAGDLALAPYYLAMGLPGMQLLLLADVLLYLQAAPEAASKVSGEAARAG